MGVEWCVYPGDASFQLIPRYPRHWGIVSRSWLRKPTCRNPVTPRPNRLKLGGSVGCGCSRSEASRSREVCCIFWRGMGGTWIINFWKCHMWTHAHAGSHKCRTVCSQHQWFCSLSRPRNSCRASRRKVLDFSHKCPTDTLTRTGCALPWCSVQVRMGLNE